MMDYLTVNKIHPMIWSPLAGGRLFQEDDLQCNKAMDKIKEIAERHNCEPRYRSVCMDHVSSSTGNADRWKQKG